MEFWVILWHLHIFPLCFFFPLLFRSSAICENESRSVMSDSLQPYVLYSPWNSPHQDTGVGSCSFLQGNLPNSGIEPRSPHCRKILYQLSHQGSPLQFKTKPFSVRHHFFHVSVIWKISLIFLNEWYREVSLSMFIASRNILSTPNSTQLDSCIWIAAVSVIFQTALMVIWASNLKGSVWP